MQFFVCSINIVNSSFDVVAFSGDLSSRSRINRGNRSEIPLFDIVSVLPAIYIGDNVKEAALISQTNRGMTKLSGLSFTNILVCCCIGSNSL